MKKNEEIRPSTYTKEYWIWVRSPHGRSIPKNPVKRKSLRTRQLMAGKLKSGKWLIFADLKSVDDIWKKIKEATEAGRLGTSAKVRSAMPDPTEPAEWRKSRVICVYTNDWTDREDVMRVREELRNLGITDKIPYKADEDTLSGKYAVSGHKRIAKYWA